MKKQKQFHIINVGNSLLTNFQKVTPEISKVSQADNEFWKKMIEDTKFLDSIFNFLKNNPKENSAEMNTFLRVVENVEPNDVEVYLSGTNTYSNEICVRTIQRFLKAEGYRIYDNPTFSGYFFEASRYDDEYAKNEFVKGVAEMLDRFIYLALKKMEEGYQVFINPTGGLKAHVIACALAGFLTGSEVYYMNEEFRTVVYLPKLFYLPKGREVELLNILSDKKPRSGPEFEKIQKTFQDEMERLRVYGLVEIESDEETGKPFRVKITNRGYLFVMYYKEKNS
ncbi:MAG: putative CRISPR-associated protein [Candidatus Kryptonium sp.]|nr:putative CRISPR-associated protein [Candidatus Kryptonium sp.]MCX7761269.1 putative CRISPR-associated protein [Candidatus Kryptonium sp.]MDW8109973.1 putative CRISPR-associated protein [Candidatus Kryptonium sp.]